MNGKTLDHVSFYKERTAVITIGFPNGIETCQMCRYCRWEYGVDRSMCTLTGELLLFSKTERGLKCPIIEEE